MGNTSSTRVHTIGTALLIDRLVAADCDFLPISENTERNIRVGIMASNDSQNPMANQAIHIGDGPAYRLKTFVEGPAQLVYTFEQDVSLTLMRNKENLMYNLKTPALDVTREIDPLVARFFKPIGMVSYELDKMEKFYRPNNSFTPVSVQAVE
jgi:hypothetical protein